MLPPEFNMEEGIPEMKYLVMIVNDRIGCGNDFNFFYSKNIRRSNLIEIADRMKNNLERRGYKGIEGYLINNYPQELCEMDSYSAAKVVRGAGVKLI